LVDMSVIGRFNNFCRVKIKLQFIWNLQEAQIPFCQLVHLVVSNLIEICIPVL